MYIRLFSIFLLGILVAFWQVVTTNAEENNTPTVESVYISSTANAEADTYTSGTIDDLSPGSTRTIHINGVVEDLDGRADIEKVSTVFFRSGVTGGINCTPDNNNCYSVSSCVLSDNIDLDQKEYDCELSLQYYTDATDNSGEYAVENWVTYVKVEDKSFASSSDNSVTKEMQGLLSVDYSDTISFGSFDLGDSTDQNNNVNYTFTQNGNNQADVRVKGGEMTCESGTIAVGNIDWSLTDVASGEGVSLNTTYATTNINIGYRADDVTPLTKTMYWNLTIPTNGVGGYCESNIVIDIIPD